MPEQAATFEPAADMPIGATIRHNNITFTKTDHPDRPWRTQKFGRFTDQQMDEFRKRDAKRDAADRLIDAILAEGDRG
ncbi:hypothetical protein O7626_40240 [Micromonospora sp. WMMD1102]|uniref:hypothetical protein n=1 Tax=Micromonospora sp. WMMD1102 TaxID=3016105 RepID=UPI002414DF9B|nr:hypothetical protein [Micromonospora sp. WMMD1102]MDG4792048.1 hypothetical protein [Micromonospora sp. WMMD1102]